MKKTTIILALTATLFLSSCATNVFTGKKTLKPIGNDRLFPMAFSQYDEFLDENKVITGTSDSKMIATVGSKIKTAAQRWLNAIGHPEYLDGYEWEYNLVNDPAVNAWAMPGGKIVFYTGILPICQDETGVAIVMGHEVAHALANHGGQRMSAAQWQSIIGTGVAVGSQAAGLESGTQNLINQAYGVGSQVGGMLPFSRSHETEADKIGLYLAAMAGYNPDEGALLWERMKANSGGQSTPQILSTHPSNDSRIANLRELAPLAKAEAAKYGVTSFK
ncbi:MULTISPECIES: M48 family metallopeptidase [Nonlabens]|uniref:Peptidase M48-like protein n=1 Tax=Nonlabens xylanidelens TaxID=191564 RepID=A0A2S6IMN7_9FLAO|nr:M48 family metallopeptidase [Nonlabens xylanidelens]PPK95478.1 peptidase M48-like protein [Nonlabens xylanidelens]PQJ22293.1 peptidase M48 [Nonlabens xylanidelens]